MLKNIIVLIVEVSIIVIAIVFFKKTDNSIRRYYKSLIESDNNELKILMEKFIEIFDRFEKYFDKEMSGTEFLTELKSKGLIDEEETINIPVGTYGFKMPVYDTLELRQFLHLSGELIYEKADLMKMWHNTKIEQIDIYEEFSRKFQELNSICTKHLKKEKEIDVYPNQRLIEQKYILNHGYILTVVFLILSKIKFI